MYVTVCMIIIVSIQQGNVQHCSRDQDKDEELKSAQFESILARRTKMIKTPKILSINHLFDVTLA